MRIAILTVCFNEKEFIVPCIKQFEGFDFDHLILVSNRPWHGNYQMDETWALAKTQAAINNKVVVEIGYWPSCAEQFNYGMEKLEKAGYDWVLIVDTDEFYTPVALGQLVGQLRVSKTQTIRAPYMYVYWKTPEYLIIPQQTDKPVIAAKPSTRFKYIRNPGAVTTEMFMGEMHHMSYVRSDEQMTKKIYSFEHQHEFDKDRWYKEKWLEWTIDTMDLHPVKPYQFRKAIRNPVPPEIRRLLA